MGNYEANDDRLYRLAANRLKTYTGSEADAQDVLQDVFMLAVEKEIWSRPNPEGWLAVTTANVCKNYIRAAIRDYKSSENGHMIVLKTMCTIRCFFIAG